MNLCLLQLGDSALPIGGYSHSWGLEAAIDRGQVQDAATLEHWVRLWLHQSLGPCEGVVLAAACRAASAEDWPLVAAANELLEATLVPTTLSHASREMGEQLLALTERWEWAKPSLALWDESGRDKCGRLAPRVGRHSRSECPTVISSGRSNQADRAWHHAPVFAVLAAAAGATPGEALLVYLHQAALGVIGAGVRAIPIGHTHGQQVLSRLHDDICALAEEIAERDLATAGSFCPAYEVLCDAQTHLYTRLFRS